jgi:phosphoglycerate dehydrogenase-like enzyme
LRAIETGDESYLFRAPLGRRSPNLTAMHGGKGFPILIATPLEDALVERIARAAPDAEILFDATLLPPPRYPSDHRGRLDFERDAAQEARFATMLARAEVLYGIPGDTAAELADAIRRGPGVRWIQATAAGAGEQVRGAGLDRATLERVAITSAAGVHGGMLAEFVFLGLLVLRKDVGRLERLRAERSWEHAANGELDGSTIAIVGMGGIGQEIAVRARAFGMRVVAVTRDGSPRGDADATFPTARLTEAVANVEAVALTLPGTEQTRGLFDRAVIAALRGDCIVANVGRGTVIDQAALIEALQRGNLAGAVLDVFDPEPLPPDNPLWTMPNVVFSPHTAALSVRENERIVELFCDNLYRFERGEALRNRINPVEFY